MENIISKRKVTGFTLVELSIVIIIIGFLIAGVTAGSSLIKQSALSATITEISNYKTSINTFYERYNYLPGDFPYAAAYWSTAANCSNALVPVGCNGNGNGSVEVQLYGQATGEGGELLRVWQHLSLAGLINGNYTGVSGAVNRYDLGENVPQAKAFQDGGYYVRTENWGGYNNPSSAYITLAKFDPDIDDIISPTDLHTIDIKIDDGNPVTGSVLGYGISHVCKIGSGSSATYNYSDQVACVGGFDTGFDGPATGL